MSDLMKNDKALLVLRIALAVVLVLHGYGKLFGGMDGFTGMLDKMGFPLPVVMAWIVALLEFFGGLAIAVGLFTKYVSYLVIVQFAVILIIVKKLSFPSSDTDLLVFAAAIVLALLGAGSWSLDAKMGKKSA